MNALELFNHRYSEDEKFSWLEMVDFAEAYASQSKEECANYAHSKAVTDGEIEELAVDCANQGEFKSNFPHDWHSVHEGFKAGFAACAKWMREQQGEGAKERYEKAVANLPDLTLNISEAAKIHCALKIASGYTDKQ